MVPVRARVALAGLSPSDVTVQVYVGQVGQEGALVSGQATAADHEGPDSDDTHWFGGKVELTASGRVGMAVRLLPRHDLLSGPFDTGLIRWSEPADAG